MEKPSKGLLTMTKEKFLKELRIELELEDIPSKVIEDTINEYTAMIGDAIDGGETVAAFVKRMGNPKKVASALAHQYPQKEKRIVSLMPFFTTIAFFLLGNFLNAWHPGWLVFLLIPITSILSRKKIDKNALIFWVILTIFILSGTLYNAWAPTWALFLIIIAFNRNERTKPLQIYAKIYTFIAVFAYIALYGIIIYQSFTPNLELLPFVNDLNRDLYLNLLLLLFLPIVGYGFMSGMIQISGNVPFRLDLDFKNSNQLKQFILNLSFILVIVTGYILLGIYTGLWHPGWLMLLIIPTGYTLLKAKKFPLRELLFFFVTTLFVLGGEYISIPGQGSGYVISWLFFLLIPIFNILSSKERE
jgi:uncharacterized membrane protein